MFESIININEYAEAYQLASSAVDEYNKDHHIKSISKIHEAAIKLCRHLMQQHNDVLDDGFTLLTLINESKLKSYLPADIISSFLHIAILSDMVQRKKRGLKPYDAYTCIKRLDCLCTWITSEKSNLHSPE